MKFTTQRLSLKKFFESEVIDRCQGDAECEMKNWKQTNYLSHLWDVIWPNHEVFCEWVGVLSITPDTSYLCIIMSYWPILSKKGSVHA